MSSISFKFCPSYLRSNPNRIHTPVTNPEFSPKFDRLELNKKAISKLRMSQLSGETVGSIQKLNFSVSLVSDASPQTKTFSTLEY